MPASRNTHPWSHMAGLAAGVAALLVLTGCSLPNGRADRTLREAAVQTQEEVASLMGEVPPEWLRSSDGDTPWNDYSYCGDPIDRGPRGSAMWTYGLAYDLVTPVSNAELLELLTPSGGQWVMRPAESVPDGQTENYYFDGPDMTVWVFVDGQNQTDRRVGAAATSSCIRNGSTGPGTFSTPIPTDVPTPAPTE